MRVISTSPTATDTDLVEDFRRHLTDRDLAPATVQAYLNDIARFQAWMAWVHEDSTPPLVHVRTVDLTAFRTHLIHEQAHTPATVNRRLQGLRLFFQWLYDGNWISENPAANLRFMRKSGNPQPVALRRREVLTLVHTAAASPHGLAPRNVALVQLMLQTGLRVREVTALTHGELHLKAPSGTVHVRDSKGYKSRDIPLNATVRRALRDYVDTIPKSSAQTPVFLSKRGTSLAVRSAADRDFKAHFAWRPPVALTPPCGANTTHLTRKPTPSAPKDVSRVFVSARAGQRDAARAPLGHPRLLRNVRRNVVW